MTNDETEAAMRELDQRVLGDELANLLSEMEDGISPECSSYAVRLRRLLAVPVMATARPDTDDLRLLVLAAKAFNMGISPRSDREPQTVERLDIAVERVGSAVGIDVRRGPSSGEQTQLKEQR